MLTPFARTSFSWAHNTLPCALMTAYWHLPVCCSRESTEMILELLEVVYTDELKGMGA